MLTNTQGMGYNPESILVHGGYLINLSNNDEWVS